MPQTSLLSFFTPPTPLNTATEFAKDVTTTTSIVESDKDDKHEVIAKPSKIIESLPSSVDTTKFSNIVIPAHAPRAAIVRVQPAHIPALKNITSVLFPVRYTDKFFGECIESDIVSDLSRVLLHDSKPVGWIRCRLDVDSSPDKQAEIYVQAIGLLAPYRGQGLASALLAEVTSSVLLTRYEVTGVYAHVWETNHEALQWYDKHGFARALFVHQYYRRLKPSGAWIVRKRLKFLPDSDAAQ